MQNGHKHVCEDLWPCRPKPHACEACAVGVSTQTRHLATILFASSKWSQPRTDDNDESRTENDTGSEKPYINLPGFVSEMVELERSAAKGSNLEGGF